ncbi:MAG: DUF86 domain-containing protein [Bradyrhizobium sp.]|uniref:HepT-like ribonuclease domain-containing protein n=1 Tax=Bradyrhizobium sp. TaxID=376 RepID=UPI001E1472DA|nr:HepT-like ribonuclease domain-containing protein [Bradyrhizobium sp.]MBV9562048.1 DUF86 domain-containing protein [Bradyrhizobium sp.]
MPPTVEDRLHDILEAIQDVEKLLGGADLHKFVSDRMLRLASERLLEIVCEASRRLPDGLKAMEPNIDWRKIIDFGNVLRHAYHATDVEKVWDVVQNHQPPLKAFVERQIQALEP